MSETVEYFQNDENASARLLDLVNVTLTYSICRTELFRLYHQ